jgi:hypothetical protein
MNEIASTKKKKVQLARSDTGKRGRMHLVPAIPAFVTVGICFLYIADARQRGKLWAASAPWSSADDSG